MKKIFIVEQGPTDLYYDTSLTACLRFIGRAMSGGKPFGGLLVTAAQARAAGYTIRQA